MSQFQGQELNQTGVPYIGCLNQGINMTVEHYTNVVGKLAEGGVRKGANYLKHIGIKVTNKQVLAVRDMLLPSLKFKPYGAIKAAEKITKGFSTFGAALGIGLDVWDSYSDMKKKEEFQKAIENIVDQLEEQRQACRRVLSEEQVVVCTTP